MCVGCAAERGVWNFSGLSVPATGIVGAAASGVLTDGVSGVQGHGGHQSGGNGAASGTGVHSGVRNLM